MVLSYAEMQKCSAKGGVDYAMLCYAMLCYAMLCYAMLCYAMIYYMLYIICAVFVYVRAIR